MSPIDVSLSRNRKCETIWHGQKHDRTVETVTSPRFAKATTPAPKLYKNAPILHRPYGAAQDHGRRDCLRPPRFSPVDPA